MLEELQRALKGQAQMQYQHPENQGWSTSIANQQSSGTSASASRSAFISELAPGGLQSGTSTYPFAEPQTSTSGSGSRPDSGSSTARFQSLAQVQGNSQREMQDMQNGMNSTGIDGEAGKLGGPFMDLIWPGWPPRLPTPGS